VQDLKEPLSALFNAFSKIAVAGAKTLSFGVDLLDNLGLLKPAIYAIIGLGVANKLTSLLTPLNNLIQGIGYLGTHGLLGVLVPLEQVLNTSRMMYSSFAVLGAGIAIFVSNLDKLSSSAKVLIPVLSALAGVTAAVAIAKAGMSYKAIITAGTITAGIGMVAGTLASVKQYAEGGMPDKGTLFVAGEAGAEIVTNSPNGQTGVTNVQQIEQAFYNALVRYGGGNSSDEVIVVKVGDDEVFRASRRGANKRGLDFARKG
jgi:hypothetical protein